MTGGNRWRLNVLISLSYQFWLLSLAIPFPLAYYVFQVILCFQVSPDTFVHNHRQVRASPQFKRVSTHA